MHAAKMVGALLQETGGGGEPASEHSPELDDRTDESTEHQFDSEFAVGTRVEARPRDQFAEFDERLRELHDQLAKLQRRIEMMGGTWIAWRPR